MASRKKTKNKLLRIESFSAIKDFIEYKPHLIKRLVCKESALKKAQNLTKKIPIVVNNKIEDDLFRNMRRNIALFAEVELELGSEKFLFSHLISQQKPSVIIALDHLTDPVNVGGVVRNAAFFGVPYILVPHDRQAPISDVVMAASQGGLAFCQIIEVTNLARVLRKLKKEDFWIIGSAIKGSSVENIRNEYDHLVLVLGSEDKGMSPLISSLCDIIVTIPQKEVRGHNSLNTAVASGVLLYALS